MAFLLLWRTVVLVAKSKKILKKVTTAVCAAGLLLGLGLYAKLVLRTTTVEQRTYLEYADTMLGCSKGVYTLELILSNEVQSCILDTMKSAGEALQAAELNEAIAYTIKKQPVFFEICHDLGHPAGRYAYTVYPDITELLQVLGSTCQYALGHGVLDGFADTKPSELAYMRVVEVCVNIVDPITSSFCADGLGHVAWSSTGDLAMAAKRCSYISKQNLEEACVEGIVMQIYEPAGFAPSQDIANALRDIPSMCANWPQSDRVGNVTGCYKGAGYVFTRNLAKNSKAWDIRQVMDEQLYASVLENISYAVKGCNSLVGANAIDMCNYSLSQQYPSVIHYDKQLEDSACLPLGKWEERCRSWNISVK